MDGQRLAFGDHKTNFTLQSIIAPFLYSLAIDTHGAEYVHSKVGQEIAPGGLSNKIRLDANNRPHNPMINTGAILMSTLFGRNKTAPEKHNLMMNKLRQLCGIVNPSSEGLGFDYAAFMAERTLALHT